SLKYNNDYQSTAWDLVSTCAEGTAFVLSPSLLVTARHTYLADDTRDIFYPRIKGSQVTSGMTNISGRTRFILRDFSITITPKSKSIFSGDEESSLSIPSPYPKNSINCIRR